MRRMRRAMRMKVKQQQCKTEKFSMKKMKMI
jgi:hypothetical protein